MPLKDVTVIITRETRPVTQAGFGKPLILGAQAGGHEYKEYRDLAQVLEDFADSTDEYKMAAAVFAQSPRPEKLAIACQDTTAEPAQTLVEALAAVVEQDWYFLLCTSAVDADILALSNFINGVGDGNTERLKLFFARTNNDALGASYDVDRTIIFYHDDITTYPEARLVGRCAPEDPGSITWKFKQLTGLDPVEISAADLADLHESGLITYVEKMGYAQTSEGIVTSGEYIDVMRSMDFVQVRIEERIQRLLNTSPKVPFDNRGISLVLAEVEAVMQQATAQGIIRVDEDGNGVYAVSAPNIADVGQEDRANRHLPDVQFDFTLAGAVHDVAVHGVIRV